LSVADDLINEIKSVVGASTDASLADHLQASKAYEAFLFVTAIRAAEKEGASVSYQQIGQGPAKQFVFRTSPGHLYSTIKPYTYAVLDFPSAPSLEVHLDVRVAGKSSVFHECDVAVLTQQEAQRSRSERVAPRSSKVIAAAEAKFYAANLDLDLARSYIGLISDLSAKACCFATNITSASVTRLLSQNQSRVWYDFVVPNSVGAQRLGVFFENAFHRFRATS
jgi:hypothetical protein